MQRSRMIRLQPSHISIFWHDRASTHVKHSRKCRHTRPSKVVSAKPGSALNWKIVRFNAYGFNFSFVRERLLFPFSKDTKSPFKAPHARSKPELLRMNGCSSPNQNCFIFCQNLCPQRNLKDAIIISKHIEALKYVNHNTEIWPSPNISIQMESRPLPVSLHRSNMYSHKINIREFHSFSSWKQTQPGSHLASFCNVSLFSFII